MPHNKAMMDAMYAAGRAHNARKAGQSENSADHPAHGANAKSRRDRDDGLAQRPAADAEGESQ